jgi:hypothetical protein
VEHLETKPDATLWDILEEKTAFVRTHPNYGLAGPTEKAVREHIAQ